MKHRRCVARRGLALLCAAFLGRAAGATEAVWEQPAALDAGTLLGRSAIVGEHFEIEPKAENDGLMNRFVVGSSYQRIGAYGNSLALERAREQEAMAVLRGIKKTEAYTQGLEAAAQAPLAVTRQALTDPVGVMKSIPGAVSNLWSDVSGAIGGLRQGSEQGKSSGQMLKELLGYQRVKARLAFELGVDVYSSNAVLQTDLDDVAWSIFAGGASIDLAMTQAPVAASLSVRAANAIDGARAPLWDIPPATLLQASSEALQTMGLASDEADAIAWSSACTLSHKSVLVSLLAELADVGGRDEFARLAASASNEADCRRYVETAQLVWTYHRQQRPVESVRVAADVVSMHDADGRFVLPLRADSVFWTPKVQPFVDAFPASGKRVLWLSGVLSERSRAEFARRKITVHERVLERHPVEVDVAAVLVPARAETPDPEANPD